MAFVVFLALKNTPLAIITTYSYERLNKLHQIAGYTTLIYVILHASIYSSYFLEAGRTAVLREDVVKAGIVAGFSMLSIVLTGGILRRFDYELFYIAHVTFFMVILVALGLHRPSFKADRIPIVVVLMASVWGLDHMIRFGRLVYNSINNEATLYSLPDGGTRVVFKKPLQRACPGNQWLITVIYKLDQYGINNPRSY
ncbi:hypothetical protein F5Y16DRAFT_401438 [Xylariaceae sp. FL0255]|nr:hypothetical protein F5Y16DRAFT_401438 [Xylariaceae sp. FL0255]